MQYERSIKLIIQSKIDYISLLSVAVKAICNTVVFDEVLLYNIELCLVEAVTNVINHAYRRDPNNFVEIVVIINDYQVMFQLIDTGEQAPLPSPKKELDFSSENVMSLPESGMGLFLINSIMDHVSFDHHEGKNTFTMKKNLA